MASADSHPLAITHPQLMAFSGSETRTRHSLPHGLTTSGPNQKKKKTDPNSGNQSCLSRYQGEAHVTPSMRALQLPVPIWGIR